MCLIEEERTRSHRAQALRVGERTMKNGAMGGEAHIRALWYGGLARWSKWSAFFTTCSYVGGVSTFEPRAPRRRGRGWNRFYNARIERLRH